VSDVTFHPKDVDAFRADKKRHASNSFLTFFAGENELQRALACSCFGGKEWSVTARGMKRPVSPSDPPKPMTRPAALESARSLNAWPMDAGKPKSGPDGQNTACVSRIWQEANRGQRDARRRGLIVVAGATGSGKTTYAREIARQYIDRLLRSGEDNRPHIITYEDPIESWFARDSEEASKAGFAYTPRQKPEDVTSLGQAVSDALRQKPALLYVNEVREKREWESLLYFAGTGHLAITTTHAGSLVEAFDRILHAADVKTSSERGRVAGQIVALIHLRSFERVIIPSLWVQTGPARMALMRDGLGSLLPGTNGPCLGRAYFAEQPLVQTALEADLSGE
jgi:hypothetical protein